MVSNLPTPERRNAAQNRRHIRVTLATISLVACNNENYVKPVPPEVNAEAHPPPELQEFEVILALPRIQKQLLAVTGYHFGFGETIAQPNFCGECSLEQVFVFQHMANSKERT